MALFKACDEGDLSAVKEELSKATKLRASGPHGRTPLWIATLRGHTEIVRALVDSGLARTMVTKPDAHLGPPLLIAIENGHDEIGKILVEAGADASGTMANGKFLVGLAVKKRLAKSTAAMIREGCPLVNIDIGPTSRGCHNVATKSEGVSVVAQHLVAWGSEAGFKALHMSVALGGRFGGIMENVDSASADANERLQFNPLCEPAVIIDTLAALFGALEPYAFDEASLVDIATSVMLFGAHYGDAVVVAWLLEHAPTALQLSEADSIIAKRLCLCAALERKDAEIISTIMTRIPREAVTVARPGNVHRHWSVEQLSKNFSYKTWRPEERLSISHARHMYRYIWRYFSCPLMTAARSGNTEALEQFREMGADLNREGMVESDHLWRANYLNDFYVMHSGLTPLSMAVMTNRSKAVEWLVRDGHASINGAVPALWLAAAFERVHVAEVLLGLGADVERSHCARPILQALPALHNSREFLYQTFDLRVPPLFIAAGLGDVAMAKMLLEHKASPEGCPQDGASMSALWIASLQGNVDVMRVLLEAGASTTRRAPDGSTPLWIAARHNRAEAAQLLLSKGAPVDDRTDDGQSPLWIAACLGHMEAAKVLASANARIDLADSTWGRNPLEQAKRLRQSKMVRALRTFYASNDSVPHKARISMWILARRSQNIEESHTDASIMRQLGTVRDLPTDILLHIASLIPVPEGTQRVADKKGEGEDEDNFVHQFWWRPGMNPTGSILYKPYW